MPARIVLGAGGCDNDLDPEGRRCRLKELRLAEAAERVRAADEPRFVSGLSVSLT